MFVQEIALADCECSPQDGNYSAELKARARNYREQVSLRRPLVTHTTLCDARLISGVTNGIFTNFIHMSLIRRGAIAPGLLR